MKRILNVLICISLLISSCSKDEETIDAPAPLTASDGTYIGIVHVSSQAVEGANSYIFDRKDPAGSAWIELTWQSYNTYDDHGFLLPNAKIVPGEKYEYRARVHKDGPGFSDYTPVDVGYAYNTLPAIIDTILSETDPANPGNDLVTVFWTDSLPQSILNLQERRFTVKFADEKNLGNWATMNFISTKVLGDKTFSITHSLEKTRNNYYRVDIEFFYGLKEGPNQVSSWYVIEGERYKEL